MSEQKITSMIAERLSGAQAAVRSLEERADAMVRAIGAIAACFEAGGTLYTCGNGGSAAEALHLAEELIGRYRSNRRPLPAVCLNADPTALTCIANDFGFEEIFARQCTALLKPEDVLVIFSTSGRSENLVKALRTAREQGATTIGLLGKDGGACAELCDIAIVVKAMDGGHIQEAHQVVLHIICEAFEA